MMGLWSASHAATIDLERFRAHNQYLEQRGEFPYKGVVEYLKQSGRWNLEQWHVEDGAFGCVTGEVDGRLVSRDMLDGMCEIAFLEKSILPMSGLRVLDIGAGYGRFAHRLLELWPKAFVFCTDTIEVSRLACQKYLAFRKVTRAMVVRPEDVPLWLPRLNLAVNIHSWSECTLDEVRSWMAVLDDISMPLLFIVPHDGGELMTWGGPSYKPDLARHGWKLRSEWVGPACQPKYYSLWERA